MDYILGLEKMNSKEVILFDLDGTLVDSAPDLALAVNHMLETLSRETFDHDLIRSWVGNGAEVLVKRGLSGSTVIDEDMDSDLVAQALETFLSFYAKYLCVATVTYENVHQSLQRLQDAGFRMVIVTNKPFDFVRPLLDGLDLTHFFELTLGGDSLSRRKPDPLPLLHVCETLNLTPDQCLMVGDSKNDILAAKAAGMQSIGVSYGYNYGEDISVYEPDFVVDDFSQIVSILGEKA